MGTNPETLTTQLQESTQNIAAHDPSRRRHTSTHGGSEPCQSVRRRMLLRLRPSKGVHRPLLCCNPALTCPHAPIHAHTLRPACCAAPLVVRLLHCKPSPAKRQRVRWPPAPICKCALGLLCAILRTAEIPLNELFSKIFGRCARQVVEDGACGAGLHHPRPPPRARVLHSCCADLIHVLLTEISNQSF